MMRRLLALQIFLLMAMTAGMQGARASEGEKPVAVTYRFTPPAPREQSEADVEAKKGLGYAKSLEEATSEVEAGRAGAAFILRPTPVEQVRAVADAGETMPPKSTYFFPKLPTGIVFNPLS